MAALVQAELFPPPVRLTYEKALALAEAGAKRPDRQDCTKVHRDTWPTGVYWYREGGRWFWVTPGKEPRRITPTLCDQGAHNWYIYREEVAA